MSAKKPKKPDIRQPEKKALGAEPPKASEVNRNNKTARSTLPRLRPNSKKSQLLRHFVGGGTSTTHEAYIIFKVTALHSVVSELDKLHGITCERKTVSIKDADGRVSHVCRYWLTKGTPSWHVAKRLLEGLL